ncbi:helix-turn-helix transcriptional regulator [Rhizobium lusitanum]|uniref:DNA-binding protein n=1 Tax=Rhizobium lusitanum TaxID=293958 RepID=A0A1C3XM08_9HYPH|nr:hypothetical protein [Rhizobium lusitanum]SCB53086.1 hypothetical protein GA0061101_1623 [Rhizobium lusitanum]
MKSAAGATLRSLSLPRFALRRDEVAASLAISPSLFDSWVHEGLMPEGRKIGGVVLWDTELIRAAWQALNEYRESHADDGGENPFDNMVA